MNETYPKVTDTKSTTSLAETNSIPNAAETVSELMEIPDFVQPLFDFVTANRDEVRAWPWTGEVRLGDAIKQHPLTQTPLEPHEVPIVMADILQALAQKTEDTEGKTEEESVLEEEADIQIEGQQETEDLDDADGDKQSKTRGFMNLEVSVDDNESSGGVALAEAEIVNSPDEGDSQYTIQKENETEDIAGSWKSAFEDKRPALKETATLSSKAKVKNLVSHNIESAKGAATADATEVTAVEGLEKPKEKPDKPAPAEDFEVAEIDTATHPVEADRGITSDSEIEGLTLQITYEDIQPEQPGTSTFVFEKIEDLQNELKLSEAVVEDAEAELALEFYDGQIDPEEIAEFVEGEEVSLLFSEKPDELYEWSVDSVLETEESSLDTVGHLEVGALEQRFQIEEVEDTLIQLSEAVKKIESEEIEAVNVILNKIIEVPMNLETNNDEDGTAEAEAQAELDELFTDLLQRMNIDYTPELIESLSTLTLRCHLADEIEKMHDKNIEDQVLPASGTNEILKKLLRGLSIIKKAIAHASAIGKSALLLCRFNFAT